MPVSDFLAQVAKPENLEKCLSRSLPPFFGGEFSYFYEPHFNVLGPRWGAFVITIRAVPYSWTNHITTMVTSVSKTVLRHQTGAARSSVYDHLPIDAGTYQASVAGPGISHAARGHSRSNCVILRSPPSKTYYIERLKTCQHLFQFFS